MDSATCHCIYTYGEKCNFYNDCLRNKLKEYFAKIIWNDGIFSFSSLMTANYPHRFIPKNILIFYAQSFSHYNSEYIAQLVSANALVKRNNSYVRA